jgi:hypothetical protein
MYYAAPVSSPDGGRARFEYARLHDEANDRGSGLLRDSAGAHVFTAYEDNLKPARERHTAGEARPGRH